MFLSPSRSLACNGVPKRELGNQEGERCQSSAFNGQLLHGFFPELLLQKISGGPGILSVCRTGWKSVPTMQLTACNGWLPFFAFAFANG
jgi:hypothetical protein